MVGEILDGHAGGMSAQNLLPRHLRPPAAAPAGGAYASAAFVHLFDSGKIGNLSLAIQIKGVLHLPGGMVLRLEERVEVPEAGLDDLTLDLDKAHLQHDLSHVIDQSLVGVLLAGVDLVCGESDVVGTGSVEAVIVP